MSDGHRPSLMRALKNEWRLFWDSVRKESSKKSEDPFLTGQLEPLNLDQVKEIMRTLSDDRKQLNQQLEKLTREIEINSTQLEKIRKLGAEDEVMVKRIGALNDLGLSIVECLQRLDERVHFAHTREAEIREDIG